jgi:hypothetical protein
MGAAAIGVALWRHLMRFNPKNPDWYSIINLAFYKINFFSGSIAIVLS